MKTLLLFIPMIDTSKHMFTLFIPSREATELTENIISLYRSVDMRTMKF